MWKLPSPSKYLLNCFPTHLLPWTTGEAREFRCHRRSQGYEALERIPFRMLCMNGVLLHAAFPGRNAFARSQSSENRVASVPNHPVQGSRPPPRRISGGLYQNSAVAERDLNVAPAVRREMYIKYTCIRLRNLDCSAGTEYINNLLCRSPAAQTPILPIHSDTNCKSLR